MRRPGIAALIAVATLAAFAIGAGPRTGLAVTPETPDDVRRLAEATWARFAETFAAHPGCVRPVTVAGVWELDDRAVYEPGTATIRVRIPGTAPNLEATLLHELAHHLDASCPDRELRVDFLAATGRDPATPWWRGERWAETPAERFAEAAVRVVMDGVPAHVLIDVDPDEIEVVRGWAGG